MRKKKIVIVGDWSHKIYEESFARGLRKNNFDVFSFKTLDYFYGKISKLLLFLPIPGLSLLKINFNLIKLIKKENIDYLLSWRCIYLYPLTIRYIKSMGVVTLSYNNDDPFVYGNNYKTLWYYSSYWFWYKMSLKHFHVNYFYRAINIAESKKYGSKISKLLLPYFLPWRDKPQELNDIEKERFNCDVVFVGHFENDSRVSYLKHLVENNINVKLFGDGKYWNSKTLGKLHNYFFPVYKLEGDDYAKALCGAKICLVFLSKLNRDVYTRRCFEIPATGSLMLAERTNELKEFFEENKEACYFSSKDELLNRVNWLLKNPDIIKKISRAGMKKVWSEKHDVYSRALKLKKQIECIK